MDQKAVVQLQAKSENPDLRGSLPPPRGSRRGGEFRLNGAVPWWVVFCAWFMDVVDGELDLFVYSPAETGLIRDGRIQAACPPITVLPPLQKLCS